MPDETIVYEVTLRVTVAAGRGDAPKPYEESFYANTDAQTVHLVRAERVTPSTAYGGPA